jgi:ribosomal protein S18 acetylase RimI-like enzyme
MTDSTIAIRSAQTADLEAVLRIVGEVVVQMRSQGSDQWDETYPDGDRFQQDLTQGSLYVAMRQGEVVGFAVVDQVQPPEYASLKWSQDEALLLHRFAIAPACHRQGIASKLEAFICDLARTRGLNAIKTDTYSANEPMQALFEVLGYCKVGEMQFQGKARSFYCYEKLL